MLSEGNGNVATVVSNYKAQTGNQLSARSFSDGGGHALSADELQPAALLQAEGPKKAAHLRLT